MIHTSSTRRLRRRPHVEFLEGRALLSAGALDTTFGGTGMVTTTIGTGSSSVAVAVQSDGKVVVVGWSQGKSTPKSPTGPFTVVRYNTNGSLDSTFGSGGVAVVPGSSYILSDLAVAIQPSDGKILVAGASAVAVSNKGPSYYEDFELDRLNSNGTLDTTFGGGKGYVSTKVSPAFVMGGSTVNSILLQSNGQIVLGGNFSGTEPNNNWAGGLVLVRYNTNGSLDATFGSGGVAIDSNFGSNGAMAIDGSGRIDVASAGEVARYLSNGTLDSTFGSGGYTDPLPFGTGEANGLALQSTGQIVVYGNIGSGSTEQAGLVRLNTNGSVDTTFGTNGVYSEGRMTEFDAIVVQPTDNEIVATGLAWVNGAFDYNFWVTRVLADGSAYDSAFGTNGLSEANFNNSLGSGPPSVALDPSGNILVTGPAQPLDSFATARFLGGSTSTATALAATATTSPTMAGAPGPILGALDWSDPISLDSLTTAKHPRGT